MKLNNKGFAISTIMYMILIMAVVLITLTLSVMSARKLILDKIRKETSNNIYNAYSISYRQTLEILKSEAISYASNNSITKQSIKISDFDSSIEEEILDSYKLSNKYLTINQNNDTYDIYLGRSNTITDISNTLTPFIDIVDYKIYGDSKQQTYTGKNLFDINVLKSRTNIVDNNNIVIPNGGWTYNTGIKFSDMAPKVVAGETYVINLESTNTGDAGNAIYFSSGTRWTSNVPLQITDAMLNSTVYFYPVHGESGNKIISNIQIEKGSTVTSYEPYVGGVPSPSPASPQEIRSVGDLVTDSNDENYGKYIIPIKISSGNILNETLYVNLDEPLRKIDNYVDNIDFKNQKVVRNIKCVTFKGNESFDSTTSQVTGYFTIPIRFTETDGNFRKSTLSNYFKYNSSAPSDNIIFWGGSYNKFLYFRVSNDIGVTDETTFKNWLTTKYNSGNPVKVDFYRETPVEEEKNLPRFLGTGEYTNISIDTNIKPSKVEFTVIEKIRQL